MYYKTESIPLDQLDIGDTIVRVTEHGRDIFEGALHLLKVRTFEMDHRPIVQLDVQGGGTINCPQPEHTEVTVLRALTHDEYRSELEKMTR